jgi:hypothetical protein
MGWKSHGPRSADSKYSGQLSANLTLAVAACILASPESALFLSAQNPGLSRSYALKNYLQLRSKFSYAESRYLTRT